MAQLADVSQVIAWGMDLPAFRGKVYRLMGPDQVTKAKFESWLKRSAMEECIDASEGLSEKDKEANRHAVLSSLALRKFRWGGEMWSASMQTEAGMRKIISLMLRDNKGREVNEDFVGDMIKDDTLSPWLMGSVYVVCGMDPTMALEAGKLTVAEASKAKNASQLLLSQIMQQTPEASLKTFPNSGTSTGG